ncbi:MAG TPA: type II secretion system protein GspC [Polyangiaceae bacterium]|nr:type II secretion system protein GspC [Polyangiaceae bacterium]
MSFDLLLKRYFVLVLLGLVALVAFFQASGTMQLLGAAMTEPPSSAALALIAPKVPGLPAKAPKSAKTIMSRNAFDSVTGPVDPDSKPIELLKPPAEAKPDLTDPLAAPACEGTKALIITESTDPVWSIAALQGPGETAPKLRRVGDDAAGRQVTYIGYNPRYQSPAVWLTSGATICQVLMFATVQLPTAPAVASAPDAAASAAPVAVPARGPAKVSPEIASKIQKVSDTEYHVDRAVVEKILSDQSELMKSARVVPDTQDGKIVGVRLFGIRPDTLLGVLGLQNGDRLETINGFDMASPEKALEAYMRLRTADGLKVQLNRRGAPMNIDYKIK